MDILKFIRMSDLKFKIAVADYVVIMQTRGFYY